MAIWKWTILIFFTFIIVCITPFIIYYIVMKPKNPTFTVNSALVNDWNLTSDGQLSAFFNIGLRAHNPNHKLKLTYGDIRVSIFKDKQYLVTDSIANSNNGNIM